jgi:hypothetical protein
MISSQNPIEEIMNVLARQIPIANPPKDRELIYSRGCPAQALLGRGFSPGDRTVGKARP